MTTKIIIDCESGVEIIQHLHTIIRETKQLLRNAQLAKSFGKKDADKKLFSAKRFKWSDNNCYGTHEIAIVNPDVIDAFIDGMPKKKSNAQKL